MQQKNSLVTVGIPSYNRPGGLDRTLRCILNQSYKNLEIIVSDNCSSDPKVSDILKEYAAEDNRVTYYIQKQNITIIPNFQFLLDKANGEYFMWAADDDYWDLNFIDVCVKAMQANSDVVLCMTDLKFMTLDGKQIDSRLKRSFMHKNLFLRCFNFVKSTGENKFFFCGVYKASTVKNISLDNSWGGDHMFLYEVITRGKFFYISDVANFYYSRGGSSTGMDSVRKAFDIKRKYYFFDSYILRYTTYQFRFRHLNFFKKLGLFFSNAMGLVFNEDFILYYIFIKKPIRALINKIKRKSHEHNQ